MKTNCGTSKNILSAVMIAALLLICGAPARANVSASPSTVNFGSQAVGVASAPITVTLANTNKREVTISSASVSGAQFSYSGPSLPVALKAGQTLTATVTFTPSAAQAYTGTLTFTRANGVPTVVGLKGTGGSATTSTYKIYATPASLSFSVSAGAAATSKSVNINDTTPGPLPFTLAVDQPWITITTASSSTVPGGVVLQFGVNPSGLTAGTYSGHVLLTASSANVTPLSFPVSLIVTGGAVAPAITSQPAGKSLTTGQTATFNVATTGTSPMTFQWRKNGASVSGATSSSYTTPPVTVSDNNAQFSVMVTNAAGNATSNPAVLTVNAAAVAPSITTQPASKSITAGQTASFSVAATGTAPMTYQWSKNGAAINGATSSSYTTPAETTSDNNAQFTVVVSNSAGNAASSAAILTVNAGTVAPAISSQPANKSITAGQTATFSVTATGTAPMTYQWSKNGAAVSGATSASYTTPAETTSDNSAQFTVVVTNAAGSATSNPGILTVNPAAVAPSITSQPASKSIIAGQTASFSVAATGTAPMTYQWSKNGTAIGGATSSTYTTPAETTSDNNAQFTVVVTNSAGNATSSAGTLTVGASTLALNASSTTVSFGSVTMPNSGTQTITLTNAGNSTVTIGNVSVTGPGFNASGVATGTMLTPGQTATLTATFTPSGSGSASGSVTVTSNAPTDTISLSGTGVAAVSHSVSLSWNASASSVVGYNSYSSTTSGGPYSKLTSTPNPSTSYTDTTVAAGTTYYYVVTSVNSSNVESSYSPETSAIVP